MCLSIMYTLRKLDLCSEAHLFCHSVGRGGDGGSGSEFVCFCVFLLSVCIVVGHLLNTRGFVYWFGVCLIVVLFFKSLCSSHKTQNRKQEFMFAPREPREHPGTNEDQFGDSCGLQ